MKAIKFLATAYATYLMGTTKEVIGANTATDITFHVTPLPPTTCPTLLFYETHFDGTPAKTIEEVLPDIIKINNALRPGTNPTLHLEEPDNTTPEEFMEKLKLSIPLVPDYFQDSLISTLSLIKAAQKYGLYLNHMDASTTLREKIDADYTDGRAEMVRDGIMADSIERSCSTHGGIQVALVGCWHTGIESQLKLWGGYDMVSSIYIMDHEPFTDPSSPAGRTDNDIQVRNNISYRNLYGYGNTHVIDVYTNPGLVPVDEVLYIFHREGFSTIPCLPLLPSLPFPPVPESEVRLAGDDYHFPDEDSIS